MSREYNLIFGLSQLGQSSRLGRLGQLSRLSPLSAHERMRTAADCLRRPPWLLVKGDRPRSSTGFRSWPRISKPFRPGLVSKGRPQMSRTPVRVMIPQPAGGNQWGTLGTAAARAGATRRSSRFGRVIRRIVLTVSAPLRHRAWGPSPSRRPPGKCSSC
jgi:hypothetical protein